MVRESNRGVATVVLVLAVFMTNLDLWIVNVALPARGWAATGGLAAAAGPVLGGLLVQLDWRWVFVVNLPIGLLTLLAGWRVLPRTGTRENGRLPDLLGAVLVTAAVAALTGALVQA